MQEIQYILDKDITKLEKKVDNYLREGYVLYGGLSSHILETKKSTYSDTNILLWVQIVVLPESTRLSFVS